MYIKPEIKVILYDNNIMHCHGSHCHCGNIPDGGYGGGGCNGCPDCGPSCDNSHNHFCGGSNKSKIFEFDDYESEL